MDKQQSQLGIRQPLRSSGRWNDGPLGGSVATTALAASERGLRLVSQQHLFTRISDVSLELTVAGAEGGTVCVAALNVGQRGLAAVESPGSD